MKTFFSLKWAGMLFAAGMFFQTSPLSAQCPGTNIAYNGDMTITTCPVTTPTINTCLTNWAVSHGSPTPLFGPNGMWEWSYNNAGEGIYMGHNFIAGHTYCISVEASCNTNTGGPANPMARFWLKATSSLTPGGVPSGGQPIPVLPIGSEEVILDQNWAGTSSGSGLWITYTVTYTPTSNWSQLWIYPESPTLPQVELAFRNVVITDITRPDPCDFQPRFEWRQENCAVLFNNSSYVNPLLTVLHVEWDFGDGNTSTDYSPVHYYAHGGSYFVTLTIWVTNGQDCCRKEVTYKIDVHDCDPCEGLRENLQVTFDQSGTTVVFTASEPGPYMYAYLWDFGDGTTGTGSPITHVYPHGGFFKVCVKVFYIDREGKCCWAERCYEIYVQDRLEQNPPRSSEGTTNTNQDRFVMDDRLKERPGNQVITESITVQPNPGNGVYRLTASADISSGRLLVMDITGKVVVEMNYSTTRSWTVNIENQPAGTYFVQLRTNEGKVFSQPIIKQ